MNTTQNQNSTNKNFTSDSFREAILAKVHELGDLLERAGEKVEEKGYADIGQKIYRLGDKLEHMMGSKLGAKSNSKREESSTDTLETNAKTTPGYTYADGATSNPAYEQKKDPKFKDESEAV